MATDVERENPTDEDARDAEDARWDDDEPETDGFACLTLPGRGLDK